MESVGLHGKKTRRQLLQQSGVSDQDIALSQLQIEFPPDFAVFLPVPTPDIPEDIPQGIEVIQDQIHIPRDAERIMDAGNLAAGAAPQGQVPVDPLIPVINIEPPEAIDMETVDINDDAGMTERSRINSQTLCVREGVSGAKSPR